MVPQTFLCPCSRGDGFGELGFGTLVILPHRYGLGHAQGRPWDALAELVFPIGLVTVAPVFLTYPCSPGTQEHACAGIL